jgi:hypothetical protein
MTENFSLIQSSFTSFEILFIEKWIIYNNYTIIIVEMIILAIIQFNCIIIKVFASNEMHVNFCHNLNYY